MLPHSIHSFIHSAHVFPFGRKVKTVLYFFVRLGMMLWYQKQSCLVSEHLVDILLTTTQGSGIPTFQLAYESYQQGIKYVPSHSVPLCQ